MATSDSVRKIFRDHRLIPFLILALLIVLYVFSSRLIEASPRIETITPEVGEPGKVLIISGENFGEERNGSEVIFAGMRPNSNSYVEWSDSRISVRIPEEVNSGKLYVRKQGEESNALLFTNVNHIPKRLSGPAAPGMPYIEELDRSSGAVGALVRIRGLNFSSEQGAGRVVFSSSVKEEEPGKPVIEAGVPCLAIDFDYENWADQEISVRVPDGATSGSVRVETDRGLSNAVYFEVAGLPGDRLLPETRGYQINYVVEVENVSASPENALNLWIPNAISSLAQGNLEALRDPEPLWEDFNGVARYRLQEVEPWRRYTVSVTYWLDRSSVETRISAAKVPRDYDRDRRLYRVYTSPDSVVPSAEDYIIALGRRSIGRETNPYLKARALYRMILRDFAPGEESNGTPREFIESRRGDAFDYSLLLTATLRSVQVPARIVSGSYILPDGSTDFHYWCEFYLPSFGWVPTDPFLGDAGQEPDPTLESPEEYYFGSIDNWRVAFSRGIVDIKPTDPKSLLRVKDRVYSLQTIHEEAVGNIEDYQSRWRPVKVIDRW